MFELTRTVRFSICPHQTPEQASEAVRSNTFSAWPPMVGLGAHYEIELRCSGEPDADTGYLQNIALLDEIVRELAVPCIHRAFTDDSSVDPGRLLVELSPSIAARLDQTLKSITWRLSPSYCITVEADDMSSYQISQQFSFAASHRLHCPDLSDAENLQAFGKCNNPNGHGHNYRLEVVVRIADRAGRGGVIFTMPDLERIVDEYVIRRFDHTHLNLDTAEFANLNPTVEHIARTCFDLLDAPLRTLGTALRRVVVWETDKTSAIYEPPSGAVGV